MSSIYQHALELDGELTRERAKVDRPKKWLQELHPKMVAADHFPWELALAAQDLKKAEEKRNAALQTARSARRERDDLRRAYCQDSPLRCRPVGFCSALSRPNPLTPCPGGGVQAPVPFRVAGQHSSPSSYLSGPLASRP
ncbi:hypothetical protein LIER_38971 [Lithospermum erythrorhizon]|uniref:Uncharacterized protein n=1 Tax=Lithospermum erythrorhizon TaxID=34254 RepID=A0AAV3Q8G9_LITER